MRVMMIVDDYSGGAGNIAQLLAMEFRDSGHRIALMTACQRSVPRYQLTDITLIQIPPKEKKGNKLTRIFHSIKRIQKEIEDFETDVVISFLDNNNTEACFAVWNKKIPILVSERSNPVVIYPKFVWHRLRRIAYRRADLIAVQFDAFHRFDHGRFQKKCITIPNIIAQSPVVKVPSASDTVSFVTMARYAAIKRLPLMISMFAELNREAPHTVLHLFGKGMDNEELRTLIKELDMEERVFLHESIGNVHEELVRHDVYLMTSEQEGFPNALSEGMACGLPVVAFECHAGIRDLVHDGENGFCIPQNDRAAYIRVMARMTADAQLRYRMGECGVKIASQYHRDAVMDIWNRAIRQITDQKCGEDQ